MQLDGARLLAAAATGADDAMWRGLTQRYCDVARSTALERRLGHDSDASLT